MQINTKYKIGETLFLIYEGKICFGKVSEIKIRSYWTGITHIKYMVAGKWYVEDEVYDSAEKLVNTITKKVPEEIIDLPF